MDGAETSQIVDAFLLIEQPRQRLGHWTKALAALDAPTAPLPLAVIAYYDPTCDQALLDLQYDAVSANMHFVVDVALLAEVGLVQPAELSEGERVRFLAERLTRCTIRVTSHRTASGALAELVRKIKDVRANKVVTQPPPIPVAALARSTQPRGDTDDPVMLVNAKGTRDDLARLPDPLGNGPEPPPPPRRDTTAHERPATAPAPKRPSSPSLRPSSPSLRPSSPSSRPSSPSSRPSSPSSRPSSPSSRPSSPSSRPSSPPSRAPSPPPSASAQFANPDRNRTVEMPPEMSQRLIVESSQMFDLRSLPPPPEPSPSTQPPRSEPIALPLPPERLLTEAEPPRRVRVRPEKPTVRAKSPQFAGEHVSSSRLRSEVRTEPFVLTPQPSGPHLPNVIHARYLRSGRWVPVRVGALSLKGAALLAGALPRLNDRVDVALAFGSYRAIVRGKVLKVSTMREATQTGASTFSIAFDLDESARRQLTNLLTAARDAKITIKPPPPRATRRFPVEWQVALGTIRGAVKATALDVSVQGMFVQPLVPLDVFSTLTFSIVLDDSASPIAGRARVVRQIKDTVARECGLLPGFGLLIVSMSEADRMRWLGFLARIERRADKRVLIGADPTRLAELQSALAGLGYAVTGGTDPGALVQLANSDPRAADAVLIDADWLQNEASASLMENLFSARNVPCVTMQGEVRRARQAIDKLLEVVV